MINISLDKEGPIKFWKSSGVQAPDIRMLDPDWICLGGDLRCPSALVIYCLVK